MANDKAQIANIMRELRGVTEVAVKSIAGSVLDEVVRTTPRDTGLSAASWQAEARRAGDGRRGRPLSRWSRAGTGSAGAVTRGYRHLVARDVERRQRQRPTSCD